MPETITISVGQAGNQIAHQFWKLAHQEQNKFHSDGDTFFRSYDKRHTKARGILIDMEPAVINGIMASTQASLFEDHQLITSQSGSGNNWAQGYHQYGFEYREAIIESLRTEIEFCDSLQSIVTIQSMVP